MTFLSYWDIFGLVLITLYFILSWLDPERTQQKRKAKAEKDEYSGTHERENLKAVRDTDGLNSEAFIHGQSDIPEFVWNTSRSSLNDDAPPVSTPQEVNNPSSYKIDSSSVENKEKIQSSSLVSGLDQGSYKTTKGSLESLQDLGHALNLLNDEVPSDTLSKFSELIISPEDVSLSLAELPEKENKERVSSDFEGDEKDVSKLVQDEEVSSNSSMECNRNAEDGVEGLQSVDVVAKASVVSDFSDNLNTCSSETAASREVQTHEITSCNAEAMNSIVLQSSQQQKGEHLEKFANHLASTTIETAVDNTIRLNTFAESLSEKIFSDSADDVILEVQTSLAKQKIEGKMQKKLEMEELESLGTCVASEVVNEAVGEAALKKECMDEDELDVTAEIQPHIGFVVENVVNTAICEAASKLKRSDADEPSSPLTNTLETPRLYDKSNETETNNNVEAVSESVILSVEEPLKAETNQVVNEETSKLGSELPSDVDKPVIENLSVKISSKDVSEPVDKPVEEHSEQLLIVTDISEQKTDKQQFNENVSQLSKKSFKESAETENNRGTAEYVKAEGEASLEDLDITTSHSLVEDESKDETTFSDSLETKDKSKTEQVTAEDAFTDEKTPVEDISTSHELIDFESKDEKNIPDSLEAKDKPKTEQVTAEDAFTDEKTPVEDISTSHELIDFESKDETTISDSLEAKDKLKAEQVTAEDAFTDEKTPVEDISTSHELIDFASKDEKNIPDSLEAKDKPKTEQVTAEDAFTDEKTPVEDISTSHELIDFESKDEKNIPDSLEAKDKPKTEQVTAEDAFTDEKTPVEDISTSHELIDFESKDEITISDSLEAKDKLKAEQVTAEDAFTDEKTPVEDISTSHELIDFESKDEKNIPDSLEAKDKPKTEQVTAEDAFTDEKTPVEDISTSHELIDFESQDETAIADSLEAKDKLKAEQVTAEDAFTDEKTPVEDISTSHELIDFESRDETTIADSLEAKDKLKAEQVTAEDAFTDEKTPVEDISTSHELIDFESKDETTIADSSEAKDKPAVVLDNNIEETKDKLDKPIDKEENLAPVIPEIKLTVDKDKNSESEEETSPPCSPGLVTQHQVTLRNKEQQNSDNKEGFWRRSLILDLEEDLEFEDSISSESYDITSPDFSKEKKEVTPHSEDSEDFTDSEEDEIIDHDAEANLGAVGGSSKQVINEPKDEEFDWYDYEQDFGDEDPDGNNTFEPVFTVDGLCVSRQKEKEKPTLRSVGSHYNRAVVLDNGSGIIKLGYAGDRVPRVIQQNVTGMPQRFSMHITGMESNLRDYKKYGSQAVAKAGVMHLTHPMKAGLIENWSDIEEIWEHLLYEELGAEVGDNPVLITEVSGNPRKNREKIAEILFEHLNVPAMFLADQLPLSIYATGMTSGVCLSSGFSCTQAGVVYEGHTLAYTQQQLDIGGGDLTENLKLLLRDVRARNFTTSSGWQIVNDIKETMAFVAKDYDHDIDKYQKNDSLTQYYKLPDGQMIDIGYECMSCVEPLFQPDTLMSANTTTASQQPVHKLIDTAIKRCDPELQALCYRHIVLSGGTTLLKGFTSRLQHELHHINHRIRKIRAPEHRRHSTWIGGSILASLPSFDEQYVTVDDYSESGPNIIQKKCF